MGCITSKNILSKEINLDDNGQNGQIIIKANLNEKDTDIITLIYKTTNYTIGDKIKIFGEKFIQNNKDKCKIIYNDKKYELNDHFTLIEINNNQTLEIKLKGIKNITNISGMFSYNYRIISSPDISNWNTINITNLTHLFFECFSTQKM